MGMTKRPRSTVQFDKLSGDACMVAKTIFAHMGKHSTLSYGNVLGKCPERLRKALNELVEGGFVVYGKDGKADVWKRAFTADFTPFLRMKISKEAATIMLSPEPL